MKGKMILLAAAFLGLLTSHLHLSCTLSYGGEKAEGRYSPAALRQGLAAADAAALEILPLSTEAASPRLRWFLTLRPPEGESGFIADMALRATEGVAVYDGIFLDGAQIGLVTNGAQLTGRLQAWLYDGMPRGARYAGFSEEIELRPLYAREGAAGTPGGMLPVLTEAVHAWYSDADGNTIPG